MATTKTPSKSRTTKKTNDLADLGTIIAPPSLPEREATVGDTSMHNLPNLSPTGKFMYVTSMNLRRSVLTGDGVKHCKIVISGDDFRKLTAEGLKHGVTWDEMLRAAITEQCHNSIPFGSSVKFLPPSDDLD